MTLLLLLCSLASAGELLVIGDGSALVVVADQAILGGAHNIHDLGPKVVETPLHLMALPGSTQVASTVVQVPADAVWTVQVVDKTWQLGRFDAREVAGRSKSKNALASQKWSPLKEAKLPAPDIGLVPEMSPLKALHWIRFENHTDRAWTWWLDDKREEVILRGQTRVLAHPSREVHLRGAGQVVTMVLEPNGLVVRMPAKGAVTFSPDWREAIGPGDLPPR